MTPKYTKQSIIKMAKRWAKVHGHAPSQRRWRTVDTTSDTPHPSAPTVRRYFGSWTNFMAAAGFKPNPLGRPKGIKSHPKATKGNDGVAPPTAYTPPIDFDWARLGAELDVMVGMIRQDVETTVTKAVERALATHKLLQDIATTPDVPAENGHAHEPGFFRRLIRA